MQNINFQAEYFFYQNIMRNKVLILGGYGNFGKMISRGLVKQNIPVVIAGRSPSKMKDFITKFGQTDMIEQLIIDVHKGFDKYLQNNKPKLVINTIGPFQPFEQQSLSIAKDCINKRVNYIDLSDGRQYFKQIGRLHNQALKNQTMVITGASTAPGLSSALIQHFLPKFKRIQSIYYGFSPGQKSTRGGEATAKGVMSYVGKRIQPYGNIERPLYGWQNLYAQKYPGIGYRLMGNIDHPDLDLFPKVYNLQDIHFSAGVQSKFLHLGIWFMSWLVRLGLPINLSKNSADLLKISHYLFDWMGTDVGVMHMKITGVNLNDKKCEKTWYLVARNGDGPNVATVPVILLSGKIYRNQLNMPGVHPCVGLVTLEQYIDYLKKFNIQTFIQQKQLN